MIIISVIVKWFKDMYEWKIFLNFFDKGYYLGFFFY